jgi:hypothetical protein
MNNSKGIILLPLLIYISTLSIWQEKGRKLYKFLFGLFFFLFSIRLFSVLQVSKLGGPEVLAIDNNAAGLPWFLSPFVTLSFRFDQFARIADVHFAASNSLGGIDSWFLYFLNNLMWNPDGGRSAATFGQIWNQLVTNQTIPGARLSDVSLAQGMIAEGLVWSGTASLIVECLILSCVFIWISRLTEKGPLSLVLAFSLLGNAAIFEMGLVQFAADLSGSLKILIFLWFSKKVLFNRLKR